MLHSIIGHGWRRKQAHDESHDWIHSPEYRRYSPKILEPALAALAAKHASDKEIAEMEQILRRQEKTVSRGDIAIDEDCEFHYAIARTSENTVVLRVLEALMGLLRETRQRSLRVEGHPQKSAAGHWRILAAIKRRDGAAAHNAMRRHIEKFEENRTQ